MAPNSTKPSGVRLTPLAAYLDTATRTAHSLTLGTYLAIARTPGPSWKTYDEIVDDLTALTGRELNRVSVKTFTEITYCIPNTRYVTVNGKAVAMPKQVPTDTVDAYLVALDGDRLSVEGVADAARPAREAAENREMQESMNADGDL